MLLPSSYLILAQNIYNQLGTIDVLGVVKNNFLECFLIEMTGRINTTEEVNLVPVIGCRP
ncbi:MAG: hypothetical protein WDM70_10345 [Nitrosomonadales bacterium]